MTGPFDWADREVNRHDSSDHPYRQKLAFALIMTWALLHFRQARSNWAAERKTWEDLAGSLGIDMRLDVTGQPHFPEENHDRQQ